MTIYGSIAQDTLLILAATLDDLEAQRKATDNRIRSLRQVGGYGDEADNTPEMLVLTAIAEQISGVEAQAELALKRAMRAHPLGPWVKRTTGVGEKTGARLLAAIGDPAWNTLHDRPRTLAELRSYCGYGDPQQQKRRKGQRANWSNEAKMRAFLCAEAAIKAGVRKVREPDDSDGYDLDARQAITDYGQVYLDGRAKYLHSVHPWPCERCTGKGQPPAEVGSPRKPSHEHAMAVRLVSKAILADLYNEAVSLRADHVELGAQWSSVGSEAQAVAS